MTGKRARKTPSGKANSSTFMGAHVLLADAPRLAGTRSTHAQHSAVTNGSDAPLPVGSDEDRLGAVTIVRRLLGEGQDDEETLARICAALRDGFDWDIVTFHSAMRGDSLPSRIVAFRPNSQTRDGVPTSDGAALATIARKREHAYATGQALWVTDIRRGRRVAAAESGARSLFILPVRGRNGVLGLIECQSARPRPPEDALMQSTDALGSAIGRFLEREHTSSASDEKRGEEAVTLADAALQLDQVGAAFEASPDSMIVFDNQGRLLRANEADRDLLGYSARDGVVARTLRERERLFQFRDERGQPFVESRSPYQRILRGETIRGNQAADVMLRTLDGRDIQVNISGAPLYDEKRQIIGGVAISREVTERRQRERTLEELNRRMKEFLGEAAHDLRAPVTSARGYIQLAAKRLNGIVNAATVESSALVGRVEDVRGNLLEAEQSTFRLSRLLDRLLDVTRIQAEKLRVQPEPADLAAIVSTVVREHQMMDPTRTFRLSLPEFPVPTLADAERIRQVIANYLSNAARFSSAERPIEVRLDADAHEARVSVRDEGVGIAASQHEHIWARFEQLGAGRPTGGSSIGLGLGLYISRAIVEAHGGHVGVESVPGHGSTFWFSLPPATPLGVDSSDINLSC